MEEAAKSTGWDLNVTQNGIRSGNLEVGEPQLGLDMRLTYLVDKKFVK